MLRNVRRLLLTFERKLPSSSSMKLHSAALPNSSSPLQIPAETLTKPQLKALVLRHHVQGKFYDLVRNVVASPSVLLTACRNLVVSRPINGDSSLDSVYLRESVSKEFSIEEMCSQLCENQFDVRACCVKMVPSGDEGECLILPNLKLKVLIEAIWMILEIVYDERFVTFSYGGRVGMGRHTAIRYLRNSVQNPTWWFTIAFNREGFDNCHVNKLCLFIEAKIKDEILICLLRSLFEYEAVKIELGGCYFGRGFPQESRLSSILVNIYFSGLDKELQSIRLNRNQENAKLDSNKLTTTVGAFYNPVKIYVVRYLDEILVITSGSKVLTMDLKNKVLQYLELNLELKVDKLNTSIHSAVSEKIDFLGMELQAVVPSVLHRPMSEKAIRARKKYLRQKEVRSLELKNARERNRKKLGLKILSNVFKKLRTGDGFKFEFQIENEVKEIFRSWADEVVKDFFQPLEDRSEWHRKLTAGDFLTLNHIRDQLPQELVDAYDKFQEQVNQYLNPLKARKAMEEEERRVMEEDEQRYTKKTVEDLTRLQVKVDAPIELVKKAVKMIGFTNKMGRPRPIDFLIALEDVDIIKWYAGVGKRWLDFFCCCRNFKMIKTIVTYHLRFSCILTLAEKHESTKHEAMRHFTKDLKVSDMEKNEEIHFPTEREIKMMGDRSLSDPFPVDGALALSLTRMAYDEPSVSCIAHFCGRTDTRLYRVRLLQNRLNINPLDHKKWVRGLGVIHRSLDRKCLPLCAGHIHELYMGKMCLQDIDCTLVLDIN